MHVIGGLLLSSLALGAPVTCFMPPAYGNWKASRWPRHPTSAAHVYSAGLNVPTFRTRKATMIASRTRKAQVKLWSSALDDTPADSTAATARAPTLGESSAASNTADDACPPSSGSPVDGIQRSAQSVPPVASSASTSLLPLALLNAVTLLWGTQHAVIKLVLREDLSPGVTNFARFGIAALLFSPWTPGVLRNPPSIPFSPAADGNDVGEASPLEARTKDIGGNGAAGGGGGSASETWKAGAELGLWMFMGFAFQSIGLGYTTAR